MTDTDRLDSWEYGDLLEVMDIDGMPLIAHDDRLLLRAQKSEVGLSPSWKLGTQKVYEGEWGLPKIVSWHLRDDVSVSVKDLDTVPLEARHRYLPQFERTVPIEGIRITLRNNQVDIALNDLQRDIRSRYLKSLDIAAELTERGVLSYRPRVGEPTIRNLREAIRHRLRRYLRVTEYEHNLLIRGDLGAAIFKALRPYDKAPESYDNTVYLKGYRNYKGSEVSQKMYCASVKEGRADPPDKALWKIETTFRKGYFKRRGYRDVSRFIEQPDIQDMLLSDLCRNIEGVIKKVGGDNSIMNRLQGELELDTQDSNAKQVSLSLLRRELTLTERVQRLEKGQVDHDRRLRDIEHRLRGRGI